MNNKIEPPMSKLIFFVDDDKMILNLLEYTFNKNEFEVKTFKTGEECLAALNNQNPDLIVLDHIFEKVETQLNGMDTLIKIKEVNKAVPVIMLSSQQDLNLIPEFLNNGASKYIKKDSFFLDSLTESISLVLPN